MEKRLRLVCLLLLKTFLYSLFVFFLFNHYEAYVKVFVSWVYFFLKACSLIIWTEHLNEPKEEDEKTSPNCFFFFFVFKNFQNLVDFGWEIDYQILRSMDGFLVLTSYRLRSFLIWTLWILEKWSWWFLPTCLSLPLGVIENVEYRSNWKWLRL